MLCVTLRPAGAAPKIIAALTVFAGLFHPMHHRFAAFFADLARGLGKSLYLSGKLVISRSYNSAVLRLPFRNIIKGLLHIASELVLDEGKMPGEAGDNLFAKGRRHEEAFFRGDVAPAGNGVYDRRIG